VYKGLYRKGAYADPDERRRLEALVKGPERPARRFMRGRLQGSSATGSPGTSGATESPETSPATESSGTSAATRSPGTSGDGGNLRPPDQGRLF
jgi:hypothetical protein